MEEFELEPGEQVTRTVRKHWLVFVGMLLPFVFLAVLPLFFPSIFAWVTRAYPAYAPMLTGLTGSNPLVRLVLGIWWFVLWIAAFNAFTQYFLNVWVITTQRIVEIHQYGFFDRKVSSFLLVRVQDVTTTVDGIFADIFGFGSVQVETAGTASHMFVMDGVADPVGMRDLIMREISVLNQASQTHV